MPTGLALVDLFVPPKLRRNELGPPDIHADPQPAYFLAEVIQAHPRLLIIGPKNSGKTTLLRFLALHHATRLTVGWDASPARPDDDLGPAKLPFLVDIARLRRATTHPPTVGLVATLCQILKPDLMSHDVFDAWVKAELMAGSAVLLLDGFNAANNGEQGDGVVLALDDLLASIHPANRVIVTSQTHADGLTSTALTPFALCDMDGPHMRQFVTHWLTAVAARGGTTVHAAQINRRASKLLNDLRTTPTLRQMAKTSGHMALLIIQAIHGVPLPQRRTALVRQLLDACLDDEPTQRLFPATFGLGGIVCVNALSRLALWMQVEQHDTIGEAQAVEQITRLLTSESDKPLSRMTTQARAQTILKHIADHAGLLTCIDRATYRFAVPLLFEYLAAHELLLRQDVLTQIKAHRDDRLWRDVLVSSVAQMSAKDSLLAQRAIRDAILEADAELASRHNLVLAAHCLGECERGIDKDWLRVVAHELGNLWLSTRIDSDVGETLADTFAAISGSELAEQVASCLLDGLDSGRAGAGVTVRVLEGLGTLSHSSPQVNKAVARALSNPGVSVRQAAAKALGLLGGHSPDVIQALSGALGDPIRAVRQAAIKSLGYIAWPDDGVRALLVQHLSDPLPDNAASEALAAIYGADETLIEEAVSRLRNTATRDGGLALLHALAAYPRPPGAYDQIEVERRVVALSRDESPTVRKSAIWLMQRLGMASDAVVDALLARMNDDRVRNSAAEALERIANKNAQRVVAGLISLTQASDRYVQRAAKATLERINSKAP